MEASPPRFLTVIPLLSVCFLFASVQSIPPFLGTHPLDEKFYASEVIKCKDGSKSFTRDRLNDDFCDCVDGTDEPGTSACAAGKFYCKNVGSTPKFIFSSRVNDHYCDCCDGSDEYDGCVNCPNTCVMGGNVEYKTNRYISAVCDLNSIDATETTDGVNKEEFIQKLRGLKTGIVLQVVLVCAVALRIIYWRVRSRRRRYR